MIKIFAFILNTINNNKTFVILMFIFNLTTALNVLYKYNNLWDIFRYFMTSALKIIFFVVILNILLSLLRQKILSGALKIFLLILSSLIFIVDSFCLYKYQSLLNYGILEILLATNISESLEFIEMYILNIPTGISLLILLLIVMILYKTTDKSLSSAKLTALIIAISIIVSIPAAIKNFKDFSSNAFSISRVAYMLPNVYNNINLYQNISKKAVHDVVLTKDDSSIPIVTFIIGESTGRTHMQIYGYPLPTTPYLSKRESNGELYKFTDVVSPHSHTMPVLEKLFTFYRTGAQGEWFSYNNLFDILKAANYHTEWLSNQESSGLYGNASKLYSECCDVKKFTKIRDTLDDKNYDIFYSDELLIPLLDESLLSTSYKNFYVLHLMGTHGNYKRRYPKEYNKFSAEDETGSNEDIRQTRAEYDNAILFNDYIVNEIIKRFEDKNAIVIYISDHGDDVYDERNFAGHMESEGSKFMIEIPMIIWTSNQFKANYAELEQRFTQSLDKSFMTDDMIHMILDIMRIETRDYDPTKSLINANYNESRERSYSGHIYDKENGLR